MKEIARTPDGGHIVEMTLTEFREFQRLNEAVTGKSYFDHFSPEPSRMIDVDFSNVFHVIRAYYHNRFKVNELQDLLDEIKRVLEKGG
jgi:hypothetical protein